MAVYPIVEGGRMDAGKGVCNHHAALGHKRHVQWYHQTEEDSSYSIF